MAVVLRLKRMGTNKKPFFRIVVADKASPKEGRFIDAIGHYDPKKNPATIKIDKERALYWLKNGAKPSTTVNSILRKQGIRKPATSKQ
ncbi:MAG: 30S ribosomal protein S16 [Omnitrophica bacterium RBG_13_46_9]|nr:MAG: 30S ribosomal protein S16 [Omnitrophica bacterium RBG_13_46_9]